MSWLFTASRHPDLLTEAIDAGAAHAAACFTHALFTLAGELLREDTTTTNDADPQWAAEQATRQAAADHHRRAARRRLGDHTSRLRRALEQLAATATGLVAHRQGVPALLPPPPRHTPNAPTPTTPLHPDPASITRSTDPDGTTRLHATTPVGNWQATFSPGTPQQVIDAAHHAAAST